MLWRAGSGEQNYSVGDTAFWLNTGWRIVHGQIPHNDFSLTTGTFLGYLTAWGMQLRGPCVGSIAAGQALLGLALGALSFAVLRRRASPGLALLGTLFCALLVMATRQPGEAFYERSHAFLYNRVAEGLLSLFYWILLVPPRAGGPRATVAEHVLAGGLLCLMGFTKFSYGLAGGLLLGVAWITGRLSSSRAAGVALGLGLTGAWIHVALGIDPSAWLQDITQPFRTDYGSTQVRRLFAGIVKGLPSLFVLGGLGWILLTQQRDRRVGPLLLILSATWGLAVLGTVASQQRQEYLLPIAAALALLIAIENAEPPTGRVMRRWAWGLTLVLLLPHLLRDAASLLSSWRSAQRPPAAEARIDAPALSDFRLAARLDGFAREMNDGLALIRAHTPPDAPVMAFDYSDPYAFALQRPPPKGGSVFWYPGFSFSPRAYPSPERIFRGAPWVLLTRQARYREPVLAIYGDWLASQYDVHAESEYYTLYRPRAKE